jgi:hypothetical protein
MSFMALSKDIIREITDLRYFPLTALAICLPGGFIFFAPESWVDSVIRSPRLPDPWNLWLGLLSLYGASFLVVWLLGKILWFMTWPFLRWKRPKGDLSGWDDNAPGRS